MILLRFIWYVGAHRGSRCGTVLQPLALHPSGLRPVGGLRGRLAEEQDVERKHALRSNDMHMSKHACAPPALPAEHETTGGVNKTTSLHETQRETRDLETTHSSSAPAVRMVADLILESSGKDLSR